MEALIEKWNSLTDQQKAAFGDRWITHETNLRAWCKQFDDLSKQKKERVIKTIGDIDAANLNNFAGFGIA